MKHFKYSILAILTLLLTIGVAFAQPVPIGMDRQPRPFESNPTAHVATNMGVVGTPEQMYDGNLILGGNMKLGSGFTVPAHLVVSGFDVPGNPFPIEWVDLKIKYHIPVPTNDDLYRIEYTTDGGANWIDLVSDTTEAFDVGGSPPPIRPFAMIVPTGGGAWTWNDIANLQVRVYITRGGFGYDNRDLYILEMWATVYPEPLPPTSSPTVSIQPGNITTGPTGMIFPNFCFVDVYVMDMVNMLGYELVISYDPGVITVPAGGTFTYYPFKSEVFPPAIDNVAGYVSIAYYTFGGDPDGLTGNGPIARIYFQVADIGVPPTSDMSLIQFDVVKISDTLGGRIEATPYNGMFQIAKYLSAADATLTPIQIDLTDPVGTHWHEIYPTYSQEWDIIDWIDNGDGILSYCDYIDIGDPATLYHVDEVTVTIWFTIKPADPYGWDGMQMAVEPEEPTNELIPEPIGSMWHQIFPPDFYSMTFEITSWDDNGDGVFSVSDQFDFEYPFFDPGVAHWAHLDAVSTDIIISPGEPTPEFPFGIGVLMILAPAIPLAYLWRLRKKRW